MVDKKEIDNVRDIMEKSRKFAKTPEDVKKLDKIIEGFNKSSKKYLKSKVK